MTNRYVVRWSLRANGVVEPQDIVGAVYGQTGGLFTGKRNLDDLEEDGKTDGVVVDVESEDGRTKGKVYILSNLDVQGTAELAAVLETIEQIGPCEAEVEFDGIKLARESERRSIDRRELYELFSADGTGSS